MSKDLIHMQHCNINQVEGNFGKTDWVIRKNLTGEELHKLPSVLNENQVFDLIGFIKKVELDAFNAGIETQKKHKNIVLNNEIDGQKKQIKELADHNILLANKLHELIDVE